MRAGHVTRSLRAPGRPAAQFPLRFRLFPTRSSAPIFQTETYHAGASQCRVVIAILMFFTAFFCLGYFGVFLFFFSSCTCCPLQLSEFSSSHKYPNLTPFRLVLDLPSSSAAQLLWHHGKTNSPSREQEILPYSTDTSASRGEKLVPSKKLLIDIPIPLYLSSFLLLGVRPTTYL